MELTYRASLVRNASHIVAGIGAIADAPDGGVFVHCASGKDRTGMIVALALRVAGVADAAIAADYAYTSVCLGDLMARTLAAAPSAAERARVAEVWGAPPRRSWPCWTGSTPTSTGRRDTCGRTV